METISVNKTDEVLQTLKKIDKKIDLLEAKSIENISKLIDDKFYEGKEILFPLLELCLVETLSGWTAPA